MIRGATLALVLAVGSVVHAAGPPKGKFVIHQPLKSGWGPVALAIVSLEQGYPVPDTNYCPTEEGADPAKQICLGASLADHRGHIVRLLAATPNFGNGKDMRRFRQIGTHAMREIDGGRLIAVLEKTDKGYFWMPWVAPLDHGTACLPSDLIATFAIQTSARNQPGEAGRICVRPD